MAVRAPRRAAAGPHEALRRAIHNPSSRSTNWWRRRARRRCRESPSSSARVRRRSAHRRSGRSAPSTRIPGSVASSIASPRPTGRGDARADAPAWNGKPRQSTDSAPAGNANASVRAGDIAVEAPGCGARAPLPTPRPPLGPRHLRWGHTSGNLRGAGAASPHSLADIPLILRHSARARALRYAFPVVTRVQLLA